MDDLRLMLIDGMIHTEVDTLSLGSPSDYVNVLDLAEECSGSPGTCSSSGSAAAPSRGDTRGTAGASTRWRSIRRGADRREVVRARADRRARLPYGRREFLAERDGRYDLIIVDAFGSGAIPFHLVTREAFALCKSRLAPTESSP